MRDRKRSQRKYRKCDFFRKIRIVVGGDRSCVLDRYRPRRELFLSDIAKTSSADRMMIGRYPKLRRMFGGRIRLLMSCIGRSVIFENMHWGS